MKLSRKLSVLFASLIFISVLTCMALEAGTKSQSRLIERTSFSATCFCKISKDDLRGKTSATGVVKDITGEVNKHYTGIYQQSEENQDSCKLDCKTIASTYIQNQSLA